MENLTWGLMMMLVGMGVVFALLAALMALLLLIGRLDRQPREAPAAMEAPPVEERPDPDAAPHVRIVADGLDEDQVAAITVAVITHAENRRRLAAPRPAPTPRAASCSRAGGSPSGAPSPSNPSSGGRPMRRYTISVNDTTKVLDVEAIGANSFRVQIDGRLVDVTLEDHRDLAHSAVTPALVPRQPSTVAAPAAPAAPAASPGPRRLRGGRTGCRCGAADVSGGVRRGGRDKMTAPCPG